MDYNFHTHTVRCSHATGTEREYIESAIAAGIKELGFSDHISFIFPDGTENFYRVPVVEVDNYINTINELKVEYKDKINIYVGFEVEYYPKYFDKMVENARRWGAEYLILGQHSVGSEPEYFFWTASPTNDENIVKDYADRIVAAITSGVFTYVAHPDMLDFLGDDEIYVREMSKICQAAQDKRVPLEINFLGIRENRRYPNERFWRVAQNFDVDVVFGFDAHDVAGAGDTHSLKRAMEICEKYKLHVLKKPELVRI